LPTNSGEVTKKAGNELPDYRLFCFRKETGVQRKKEKEKCIEIAKGSSKNYFPFSGIENNWFNCFMVSLLQELSNRTIEQSNH
jgi:hypothetical protein